MWTFRWLNRPATKVIQFCRDEEVRGSLSLDADNKEDIALFRRLEEYFIEIQPDESATHTRIN